MVNEVKKPPLVDNSSGSYGTTPLITVVEYGHDEVCKCFTANKGKFRGDRLSSRNDPYLCCYFRLILLRHKNSATSTLAQSKFQGQSS